jgi:phosphoribosylamine--glycine ligase
MGDPETEAVLPRLQNDLLELFVATSQGRLNEIEVKIDPRHAATIVAVSGGYPGDYNKGLVIDFGYEHNPEAKAAMQENILHVFHAGTKIENDEVVTNGGRVLAITACAETGQQAVEKAKGLLSQIYFDEMYYRRDIGFEFLNPILNK